MTTIYSTNPQGTPEWRAERAGKLTASRFKDLTATLKNGTPAASRATVIAACTVERLTGHPDDGVFVTEAMRRGTELEPVAREAYVHHTGNAVALAGFAQRTDCPYVGASVDGLVGGDGMIEIKCPASMQKHLDALLTGAHAVEYQAQIQGCLWITGRQWCDAVSYDPRFGELALAIVRVQRDEAFITTLAATCAAANDEVDENVKTLKAQIAKSSDWGA